MAFPEHVGLRLTLIGRFVYDGKHRQIQELRLPSDMKEGWGITHDYTIDYQNLERAHGALERGETDVEKKFETRKLLFKLKK
jgi:hypothetical protein